VTNDLATPRQFHVATKFTDGKVAISGGLSFGGSPTPQSGTETFDPTAQLASVTWGVGSGLSTGRTKPSGAYASGQNLLIVIGGSTSATPAASPGVDQVTSP
jgi:hypothetical protein